MLPFVLLYVVVGTLVMLVVSDRSPSLRFFANLCSAIVGIAFALFLVTQNQEKYAVGVIAFALLCASQLTRTDTAAPRPVQKAIEAPAPFVPHLRLVK